MSRDDAYRVVQRASRRAIEEGRNFRDVVEVDDEVTLSADVLARAFDLDRLLAHRRRVLDALTWRV
jgi:adenylosuccinate lyase